MMMGVTNMPATGREMEWCDEFEFELTELDEDFIYAKFGEYIEPKLQMMIDTRLMLTVWVRCNSSCQAIEDTNIRRRRMK